MHAVDRDDQTVLVRVVRAYRALAPIEDGLAIRPQSAARRPTSSHGVVAGGGGGGGGGSPPCDAAVGSSTWICSPVLDAVGHLNLKRAAPFCRDLEHVTRVEACRAPRRSPARSPARRRPTDRPGSCSSTGRSTSINMPGPTPSGTVIVTLLIAGEYGHRVALARRRRAPRFA